LRDGRDFPLAEFRSRHSAATEAVGYGKSLMLFHMLRREIGDDAFRDAMADFYRKNRGRRAGFGDIRASVGSVTGEDHSAFFTRWVERAGAPSLALRDVTVAGPDAEGGFTISGVLEQTQRGDPFTLAVPALIATDSGQRPVRIETDSASQPFTFKTLARPTALAVDPAFDLFRLLDPHETPASIGQMISASTTSPRRS